VWIGKTVSVTDSLVPTHRRTITIESFDVDAGYEIHATLTDESPWADNSVNVHTLHHMGLVVTIDRSTLTIVDARAQMEDFPHEECQTIEPAFRQLVGLSVVRGYTRAVQDRLGRQRGCSHLEFLARAIGPAAIQTMASSRSRRGDSVVTKSSTTDEGSWLVNTCHLWAQGGIGAEKVATGWHPGADRYPTPTLVELRSRARS